MCLASVIVCACFLPQCDMKNLICTQKLMFSQLSLLHQTYQKTENRRIKEEKQQCVTNPEKNVIHKGIPAK